MNHKRCPTEEELLSFVDGELSPEQLRRLDDHVSSCAACRTQVDEWRELIGDIQAPLPPPHGAASHQTVASEIAASDTAAGQTAAHVAAVMARLDEPVSSAPNQRVLWGWISTVTAAAAAVLLWVQLTPPRDDAATQHPLTPAMSIAPSKAELAADQSGQFTARGNASESSLSRDVGIQLYTYEQPLKPLEPGGKIRQHTALTAGLRNLAQETAHLLLFGVDANHVVHWIAPAFTNPDSDPAALTVHPSRSEQPLPSSVKFDDLAVGPLRVVALITKTPLHVSDIEKLTPNELTGDLVARFPQAVVRQVSVEVVP